MDNDNKDLLGDTFDNMNKKNWYIIKLSNIFTKTSRNK